MAETKLPKFKLPKLGSTFVLPIVAALILSYEMLAGSGGCVEVEPGEVAVIYNNTGIPILGDRARTVIDQGVLTFLPKLQSVERIERRPQILVMADQEDPKRGEKSEVVQRVRALTVRANDGSNFYFDRLEVHYQVIPREASNVLDKLGPGDAFKQELVAGFSRGILRDEFGRHSFLEIADPTTYGAATSEAKRRLNEHLNPYGVEVIQIITPKPKFDARVEQAIEERQNAEQEIEVQAEKRRKLEQESGLKVQSVEQEKNAEYQSLLAQLEAKRKAAENALVSSKREADKYYIERKVGAEAYRDAKITRAKANEVAYRKQAEALVAKIQAVGAQGPTVLNNVIAKKVFPQLKKIKASPLYAPAAPIDIRHISTAKGGE